MRHMDTTSQLKHLQRRGWGGNPGVPIPTTLFLRVPDYTFLCAINNSAITLIGCIFVDTGVDKGRLWWEDSLLSVQFYTTFFRCALIPTFPPPIIYSSHVFQNNFISMWVGGGSRKKRALKLIWWHPCTHICSAVFPSKVYQSKGKGWHVSQWDISKSWMQAIVFWKVIFCTEFLTGIKRSKWCARMPIFYFIFLVF